MSPFLGIHQNRLDAKGRVSVPAPFRAILKDHHGGAGLILRPSHNHACVEVWPEAAFETLGASMQGLDLFSEAHDNMAAALYADAYPITPDKEGRIAIPDRLIDHANLGESVAFLGMGRIFHIWEPKAAGDFRTAAREKTRSGAITLQARA